MRRYRTRGGSVKINMVLSEPPRYEGVSDEMQETLRHTGVNLAPSIEYLERAWQDALGGRPAAEPYVECELPSAIDSSLTDDDTWVMTMFTQYGPHDEKDWPEGARERYADACIQHLARYAPNVPDAIIEREVLAPPDIERIFGMVGGSIFQGEQGLDQMAFMRPSPLLSGYATPVHGLYLCGAGTHPGGGVMARPRPQRRQADPPRRPLLEIPPPPRRGRLLDLPGRVPGARLERERPARDLGPDRLSNRGQALVVELRQRFPGRADAEGVRLPEIVEILVVGGDVEGAGGYLAQTRALEALGDVALRNAGPPLFSLPAGPDGPHRRPEDPQHVHPTGEVPHAGRDGPARRGHPRHLAEPGIGIGHEGDDQTGEGGVKGVVLPGQLLGDADADIGAGIPRPAGLGELRRRIDRGDVLPIDPSGGDLRRQSPRPAADVEDAHSLPDPDRVHERPRQRDRVAAHEAVVVLCGRAELVDGADATALFSAPATV